MRKKELRSAFEYRLDRALVGGFGRQVLIYALAVLIVFLLIWGFAALLRIPLNSGKTDGFGDFWSLLFFFYDGGLEGTYTSNRAFVYLVNIIGSILMGGILIAAITNFFQNHTAKAEEGLLRYRLSGHTVCIGYHDAMIPLIRSVLAKGGKVVVLSERPATAVRDMISSQLDAAEARNVLVYHGLRTSREALESLCFKKATSVFVFPSPNYSDTDSVNLDVIDALAQICDKEGRTDLGCTVIFKQEISGEAFERADVNERIKRTLNFNPIVYCDSIARLLLAGDKYGNQVLDREAINEESVKYVHLFIIGLGEMGQALFCQAARQLHFPNYKTVKSRITLVGEPQELYAIQSRYREFFAATDLLDVSVQFIPPLQLDISLETALAERDALVTVAVCQEDSSEAQKRALTLPRAVYEQQIPIWLYKPDSDSIVKLMGDYSFYSNIVPFGEPGKLDFNDRSLQIAQRINWVYTCYAQTGKVPECLPDETELSKAWDRLSIKYKLSNLHHADSIPVKARSMKIGSMTDAQLDILTRVEHNRWVAETLLAGFRSPTPEERQMMVDNRELKATYKDKLVHLDLCAFDDLLPDAGGVDVREYDRVIVHSIPLLVK